ncbi:MAG TPA: hypothetical protein ENK57_10235 [Polyangiaceae bacterium]|nr:hypothetical protein [Polyangiaceae bacterium]
MRSPVGIPFELISPLSVATPPSCPDLGFPSYPRADRPNRCAEPWIATYDAPCTPENIECLLFRRRHYMWRQGRLLALLHRRPLQSASAQAKFNWCEEVLLKLIELQDDTNLAHFLFSGLGVPHLFPRTRAALGRMLPSRGGQRLPLMFPELWLTGRGDESLPPRHSALGFYVLRYFADVEKVRRAYLRLPDGRTSSLLLEHVTAAHAAVMPRPIPNRWPARGGTLGPSGARARWSPAAARAGRDVTPRALSLALFEAAPRAGQFLIGQVERATGTAPCFAGPADRACFHYEQLPIAIAGAEWTMDLLAAHAEDWIAARFGVVVEQGVQRYLRYLLPWAEKGQLALTPEELSAQVEASARREAQAASGTVIGAAAGVASAFGPVGAVAGVVLLVIGLVIQLLLEVLPLATGDGGCPRLGFRRTLTDPECAVENPQGHPEVASLILTYRDTVIFRPAAPETRSSADAAADGGAGQGATTPSSNLPLLGLGAALAAALLYALSRRRKRDDGGDPSPEPTP